MFKGNKMAGYAPTDHLFSSKRCTLISAVINPRWSVLYVALSRLNIQRFLINKLQLTISGFDENKVDELVLLREKQMLEDIKDAIEKKRDLEIKDMEGATAVSFHLFTVNSLIMDNSVKRQFP